LLEKEEQRKEVSEGKPSLTIKGHKGSFHSGERRKESQKEDGKTSKKTCLRGANFEILYGKTTTNAAKEDQKFSKVRRGTITLQKNAQQGSDTLRDAQRARRQ